MYSVSIIIPVYNVEQYIIRCLASITAQETKDFILECLLIDDCSTDSSICVAKQFVDSYKGNIIFRILDHKTNRGPSAARNTGIVAATGDYLFFLDSDDQLDHKCLATMLNYLKYYPEVDMVDANHHFIKDDGIYPGISKVELVSGQKEILGKAYMGKVSMCSTNKLMKRDLIVNNSLYFVEGMYYEDLEWINRFFHVIHSLLLIPDVTYIYEYNPSSITNTTLLHVEKSIDSFSYLLEGMLNDSGNKAYIEHKLFVFRYLLQTLDMLRKADLEKKIIIRLFNIKKRLMMQVVRDYRLILALFFLLMFKPFFYLFNLSIVRHRFFSMEKIVYNSAKLMDWLH